MLQQLRIAGLGIISDAELDFGPGLTVLSGETGAGKTMVVTGLALLFGGRSDASRVRADAGQAVAEGRVLLQPDSAAALAVVQAGGDLDEDGSLVLRRTVAANGRSRAVAGGASVPVALLARLAEDTMVLHGQSDQQRLANPVEQRLTLDRFAGLDCSPCRVAFRAWREARAELDRRVSGAQELAREEARLRAGLAEIDAAKPIAGEDVALAGELRRLEHAVALSAAARTAHDALLGDAEDPAPDAADVQSLLGRARQTLGLMHGTDLELDSFASRLHDLEAAATELGRDLAGYEAGLDLDPARLSVVQARKAVLTGLARRFGPDLAGVLAWAEQARERLVDSDSSGEALNRLREHIAAAEQRLRDEVRALSGQRQQAADTLAELISTELDGLAMASARVQILVTPRPRVAGQPSLSVDGAECHVGPEGGDDVALMLRSHPDAPALPLARGASGGELSRVMLAVEVVLAGTDPVPTMIFDEVDAGVGGRAAIEIGRRLARLAEDHQVIVVTHLAQVAAYAERHLVVDRAEAEVHGGSRAIGRSDVRTVSGEDRVIELSRMLAGDRTEAGREHARELLATAAAERRALTQAATSPRWSSNGAAAERERAPFR